MTAVPAPAVPAPAVPAPPVPSTTDGIVLRPITGPDEVELFNRLPYLFNHEIAGDLASGRRRAELLWTALDADGRLLARAGWWCPPGSTEPLLLDVLDHLPGHRATAEALLRHALAAVVPEGAVPPKYTRFLPAAGARTLPCAPPSTARSRSWNGSAPCRSWNGCAWSGAPALPCRARPGGCASGPPPVRRRWSTSAPGSSAAPWTPTAATTWPG
ncbi:hypothetical protein ACFQ1I_05465 [Kitasatospora arboriphila]